MITLSHKPAACVSAPTVTVFVRLRHAGTASVTESLLLHLLLHRSLPDLALCQTPERKKKINKTGDFKHLQKPSLAAGLVRFKPGSEIKIKDLSPA